MEKTFEMGCKSTYVIMMIDEVMVLGLGLQNYLDI